MHQDINQNPEQIVRDKIDNVQRLSSSYIASDSQVCISTIQRLYSILKGEELDESAELESPEENSWLQNYSKKKAPVPVAYNDKVPLEQFGFFEENIVSEYSYEKSVIDGVNVPYDVYTIETEITKQGAELKAKQYVDKRERLSRKKRWEQLDEDLIYKPNLLDKEVVNPSQIRESITSFDDAKTRAQELLQIDAASIFNGKLNDYLDNVRKIHEQIIDGINIDHVTKSEWDKESASKAKDIVDDFSAYLHGHKDEIQALSIFYNQPYRLRDVTFQMIKDIYDKLKKDKPVLAPLYVWDAYSQLENVKGDKPKGELIALVSLIRRVCKIDKKLVSYDHVVDKNFQKWVFGKQAGTLKFTEEQMNWLRMLKDHVTGSFHIEMNDLDYTPFDSKGGRGKMWQLFGEDMNGIIDELNEALAG